MRTLLLACLAIGVFLGLSRRGHPLLPAARVFFLPAGWLLILYALLGIAGGARVFAERPHPRLWHLGMLAMGVVGAELGEVTGHTAYRILAVPIIVLIGMALLVQALRGPSSGWLAQANRHRWGAYAGCWLFGLTWPVLVAWCFGLV